MKTWKATQVRTDFKEVLDLALQSGPQRITRDGDDFVLLSGRDFARVVSAFPEMADLILNSGFCDGDLPKRWGTTQEGERER
jgi:hypothetical protein